MSTYYALYECQLCKTKFALYNAPFNVEYKELPVILAKIFRNQSFIGTQFYDSPLLLPHNCNNGGCGVAYLIGITNPQNIKNGKPASIKRFALLKNRRRDD